MIEPYQWYVAHAREYGFKFANIGPASVDLELGDVKRYSIEAGAFIDQQPLLHNIKLGHYLKPGVFYLCSTVEYIIVPPTHCAFINMRSSWARKGLGHRMAGFIDPGFEGNVTLELETTVPCLIDRAERVVQIIYCKLTEPTDKSYDGRYKYQKGATPSY